MPEPRRPGNATTVSRALVVYDSGISIETRNRVLELKSKAAASGKRAAMRSAISQRNACGRRVASFGDLVRTAPSIVNQTLLMPSNLRPTRSWIHTRKCFTS
jgi:hypothetical protein